MSEDDIAALINELKQVQLHGQRIITALEEAYRTADSVPGTPSPRNTTRTTLPFLPKYRPGDHVIITNKVRRPFDRPINDNDRKAVVIEVVSPSRVNIRTYSGTVTWRAPKNIKHQTDE
jgi:hypothetical protein